MENIYYIHDAGSGKLIICQPGIGAISDEEQLEQIAKDEGMRWNDCSWGGVRHIKIEFADDVPDSSD